MVRLGEPWCSAYSILMEPIDLFRDRSFELIRARCLRPCHTISIIESGTPDQVLAWSFLPGHDEITHHNNSIRNGNKIDSMALLFWFTFASFREHNNYINQFNFNISIQIGNEAPLGNWLILKGQSWRTWMMFISSTWTSQLTSASFSCNKGTWRCS